MSKSREALEGLQSSWSKLESMRPTEGDFSSYGQPGLSYKTLAEVFRKWSLVVDALDERGAWISSPELALTDQSLFARINELSGLANGAVGNGVSWLASAGFLAKAAEIQQVISAIANNRRSINRDLAKELAQQGLTEIEQIIRAADAAQTVLSISEKAVTASTSAQESAEKAAAAAEQAEQARAQVSELEAAANAAERVVEKTRAAVEAAHRATEGTREANEQKQAALEERIRSLAESVATMQSTAAAATKSVEDALRSVRSQGLAQAFQNRSDKLRAERRIWSLIFVGAVLILAALASAFALELQKLSYEGLIVALLRKAAVATPAIWMGWYAARQISRVARVQEDYEYKAASALAFQSYKEEVALGADSELLKNLLNTAVTTFGENPVRLYEDHKSDPVTPTEAGLKKVPKGTISALIAALVPFLDERK